MADYLPYDAVVRQTRSYSSNFRHRVAPEDHPYAPWGQEEWKRMKLEFLQLLVWTKDKEAVEIRKLTAGNQGEAEEPVSPVTT